MSASSIASNARGHIRLRRLLMRLMLMFDKSIAEVERKMERREPMSKSKFGVMVDHLVERKQTMRDSNGKAVCYENGTPILETCMKTESTLDRGDYYGCMVRKQAEELGMEQRRLQDYTPEDLQAMARHVVGKIAAIGEQDPSSRSVVPWYPDGWKDAIRDVCDEDERIMTAPVVECAGAA